jgi:hypothetical protein
MLGCPGDDVPPGGVAGAAGSEAVVRALAAVQGQQPQLAPPPSLQTLCSLRFGRTSFGEAKKIFGKPQDESMDKTKAGLSYRYQQDKKDAVTLQLTFSWSDGSVGWGTAVFGIGGDEEDLLTGYLLSEASLTGMAYPDCWPHEEE